ncbi:MAG: putative glycosyltransferase EpsJ [candidate division WS6 bacterium OLB20]|uniref:Putative glycosyltransferase EpsJ n=1 Tax=candidate division WS6 bacterium OLB20 TaxID=1617426 RepID=A0A136LW15_9BACT|nr:MAG: putative glycosyltransferase EpsJ [candidate division WS6 bacterium OLB20]
MAKKTQINFSVVIPYYNMGAYVDEAIAAVDAQTLDGVELIIVNDGSTEPESLAVLDRIRRERTDIKIIDQQNKKLPGARNTGVKEASGRYVACLDADDSWDPEYLKKAFEVYERDTQNMIAIVTSWVQFFGERNDIWQVPDFDLPQMFIANPLQSSSTFRRSVWQELGGFDETMVHGYEDWDFWMRAVAKGYEWRSIPETLIRYRSRSDSMVVDSDKRRYELYEYILTKNSKMLAESAVPVLVQALRRYDDLHRRYNDAKGRSLVSRIANLIKP